MRVHDKMAEIERYLSELSEIVPENLQQYKSDFKTKAASERYAEKIVEAIVDLTFLLIKDKGYKIPEEDKEAFDILAQEKIISQELAERLKDAKGMRNIIAHEYGYIDDACVFQAITEELDRDAIILIKQAKENLKIK